MVPINVPLLELLYFPSDRLMVSATMLPVLVQVAPPLADLVSTSTAPPLVTVTLPDEVTLRVLLSVGSRTRMPGLEGTYVPRATARALTFSAPEPQMALKKRCWL